MLKTAFHATNNLEAIKSEGIVKPFRMLHVYLIEDEAGARKYAEEFHYKNVIQVEYDSRDVENSWRPTYINKGKVLKLREGKVARYINNSQIVMGETQHGS
jgi:hypothetical protein